MRNSSLFISLLVVMTSVCAFGQSDEMAGYLGVPNEKVPIEFDAGFSLYVAAWPLLDKYPGNRFQTGLFGTWMHAQDPKPKPKEKNYSDIEGGLGWWRDTRFATETPKFIMGGVALNFSAWANGPGAGKGRDWNKPQGKYAVAQLSPWIVWPPDGLNLKQGTSGELFGYGYLPLPLTEPKATTYGKKVPTGNQCWTLFFNTANFKGPVAFFVPSFFSRSTSERPDLFGKLLDTWKANPNRSLQMETQYIPSVTGTTKSGKIYARVAKTYFPANAQGQSVLVHRITSYKKSALWDDVMAWFKGGEPADGKVKSTASHLHKFTGKGWSSWNIKSPSLPDQKKPPVDWSRFATPFALDPHTFAYRWDPKVVDHKKAKSRGLVTLPQYYRFEKDQGKSRWVPKLGREIPIKRKLDRKQLEDKKQKKPDPYVTPKDGTWAKPGPVAGPFKAYPGDGSVVTYSWYRFADQPALLNADLSKEEREAMQIRVEKIHRLWTREREYLSPPTRGSLAALDSALVVTPPKGFEIGYVPIVTRQAAKK
ncbi:MAG: hypothetical protein ACI97A_002954 [Planctomycetota bacterium]|jgi:hypothetical protein